MNNDKINELNKDSDFFLLKMIRGDYGLFQTFWFFSFIPSVVFNLIMTIFHSKIPYNARLIMILIYSTYGLLTLIAIWKASNNYLGNKIWAYLSKISVMFGSLSLSIALIALFGIHSFENLSAEPNNQNNNQNIISEQKDNIHNFQIIRSKIETEKYNFAFIKDIKNKNNLFIHDKEEDKFYIVDNQNLYCDEINQSIVINNNNYKINDILNAKYQNKDSKKTTITFIDLYDGTSYASTELTVKEIFLIILAPQYVNDIDFFNRATRYNQY